MVPCSSMAEDTPGWSEKGKRGKSDDGESSTPSRPSKRDTSSSKSDSESSVIRTPAASSDAGARKVAKAAATAGQRDLSFSSRLGYPALIALVCILGISAVVYARSTREALATPVQNLDHWHSVYGVYSCDNVIDGAEPGEQTVEKYLPPFQSSNDELGIHSHGDGVMHIHPFFEQSSGENAQIRHFLNEMDVSITPESIVVQNIFDPTALLTAGEECADGTGTSRIVLLHWEFDFQIRADSVDENQRVSPNVITEDFGLVKFEHDREVFVFAHIGEDTDVDDIPAPPQQRFVSLDGSSAQDIEFQPESLVPRDSGVDLDGDDTDLEADTEDGGTILDLGTDTADTDTDADTEGEDG